MYLRLLVERLRWIKVKVLQNFEDSSIETFIHIHSLDDVKKLQNSLVSICIFLTFHSLPLFLSLNLDLSWDIGNF